MIPLSFKEREIVDLSNPENLNLLYAKLLDQDIIDFSEVAPNKTKINKKITSDFLSSNNNLQIVNLVANHNLSQLTGLLLKFVKYDLSLFVKNASSSSLNEFSIEMTLPNWLTNEKFSGFINENKRIITIENKSRLFPNQTISIELGTIEINNENASKINEGTVVIKVYSDLGVDEQEFGFSEIFRYKKSGYNDKILESEDFAPR